MPDARPPSIKLFPPILPSWYVPRPQLEARLDQAIEYRLTSVVAGAGYGKTTHVAARAHLHGWAWYTLDSSDSAPETFGRGVVEALRPLAPGVEEPVTASGATDERAVADSLAVALSSALEGRLEGEAVLVVDDVHELGRDAASGLLLEGLARYAPAELHLVLCSRDDPPFSIARLRGRGQVLDVAGSDLVFTEEEIATWLVERLDEGAEQLAPLLSDVTGGWPAAVHLATEVLAATPPNERRAVVETLAERRGPLVSYLADEVLAREQPAARELLRVLAHLDRATPELCEALGVADARALLADLARHGLVSEPPGGSDGSHALHVLIRDFVRTSWPVTATEARRLSRRAAAYLERHGEYGEALRAFAAAGDASAIARVLSDRSDELISSGSFDAVAEAAVILPPELRRDQTTVAQAFVVRGEYDEALRWLSGLEKNPFYGFHLSLLHQGRGETRQALEALRPGGVDRGGDTMYLAFIAYQLIILGFVDEARSYAERAAAAVPAAGPSTDLAEANMLLGELARLDGDLVAAERHARTAIEVAAEVSNVLAECSARTKLADVCVEQGDYANALAEATRALEQADRVGFTFFQAWTPRTRGEAHLAAGHLNEAFADFTDSLRVYERLGSLTVAAPLNAIGDIHRQRGEYGQARSAYTRALAASERSGNVTHASQASAGLALVLADEDPAEARALAEAAVARSQGRHLGEALLAAGWLAVHRGDRAEADTHGERSFERATKRGAPPAIAGALELRTFAAADPRTRTSMLAEALAIWQRVGNPLGEARVLLALAELGAVHDRGEIERAAQVLRDQGVPLRGLAPGLLSRLSTGQQVPLTIRTLGQFAVVRNGAPIGSGAWQSKKARDLLKLLVTRRGKTATRDFLIEALWPNEDPKKTSNRLSVALNVVRKVLDPDDRFGPDHFVAGDRDGVRLDLGHIEVDLEVFLEQAEAGLRLHRAGALDESLPLLESAEAAFRGDFLEEERYEDWAAPLRDEARSAYLEVARALASAVPGAVRFHLRILALDPYDEDTHLDLVSVHTAAGRYGEARRAYRHYVQRMGEIGVEPAPLPALGNR